MRQSRCYDLTDRHSSEDTSIMARHDSHASLCLALRDGVIDDHVHRKRTEGPATEAEARAFIAEHEKTVRPHGTRGRPGLVERQCHRPRPGLPGQGGSPEPTRCRARPTTRRSPGSRRLKASSIRDPLARAADRRALFALPREAGRSRAAAPDHGQGQRHREGVQCLSRERRTAG